MENIFSLKERMFIKIRPGGEDAVTEAAMRRDVRQMKEAGFDFIRGSHYPHAPAFSKACDEMGMLFWAEAPFWGSWGIRS